MALEHGYGVLIGTLVAHERDRPDNQGRWYHVMLTIDSAGGRYRVAVDVDSHQSTTGVQWKVVPATAADLAVVSVLPPGWHQLASASTSGALDHLRHRIARTWRLLWTGLKHRRILGWTPWWCWVSVVYRPWRTGDHLQASEALEQILTIGGPILVWGEPFDTGLGVHNVHQNQGDPIDSQWAASNGIWQDGAVAVRRPDDSYVAFLPRFSSQAMATDDQGHPVPE
ncbi:MAG: DUF2278 family protein [Micropruina sp.]|uniref:DUF2278 family protein n=1 Tax=Micropruina sp. TaxID=2737536 RepID=UPI0039E374B0